MVDGAGGIRIIIDDNNVRLWGRVNKTGKMNEYGNYPRINPRDNEIKNNK